MTLRRGERREKGKARETMATVRNGGVSVAIEVVTGLTSESCTYVSSGSESSLTDMWLDGLDWNGCFGVPRDPLVQRLSKIFNLHQAEIPKPPTSNPTFTPWRAVP